jgi:hypothetical protein
MQASARREVSKKSELNLECICFDENPERRGVLNSQANYKLPGDLQNDQFVAGFQFREEFFLLQLNCDLLVGDQDRAYSFRNG